MGLFPGTRSPEDRFAQEVLDAVHATGQVAIARYDQDAFAIVYQLPGDDSEKGRIYLHNTFQETSSLSPAERAERVNRLVAAVIGARRDTWEAARPRLRPVLRGVSFGAGVVDASRPLVSRPALPFLVELVVVDEPTSMSYVTQAQLGAWGVGPDEVFAAARANLAAMVVPLSGGDPPGERRATVLRFLDDGESYVTSRLLIEGFLSSLADRVGARPVAFMPDRDTLMVAPSDHDALATLYRMVEDQYSAATRAVSPVGYTSDDGGRVVPFAAPPGSDLHDVAHRAEILLAAAEYRAQKEALDAAHERDEVDIFVGSLLLVERADGTVASVVVWSEDLDTLMPAADLVAFQPGDSSDSTLLVPFETVAAEALLLAEPDYDPPRYRVTTWPAPPVMARLREHAVEL